MTPREVLAVDRVDLVRALCRALDLDEHGRLAPDLSRLTEGGGYISRQGAVRLVRELLRACGPGTWRAVLALEYEQGHQQGYVQGWADALDGMAWRDEQEEQVDGGRGA